MEERIAHNRLKIQVLREDYEEMVGTHAGVKQDLGVAHMQLRQLAAAAQKVREDRAGEVKVVYDRCVGMEAEARVVEAVHREHEQVVALNRSVRDANLELAAQCREVESDVITTRVEAADVGPLKSDLNTMRQQLLQARAAIEFEKKTRAANLEQYQEMERNMISIKNEIDRLRDELAHPDKRPRAATTAALIPGHGYLESYGGPDMLLHGGHSAHYPMHQTTIPDDGPYRYTAVFRPPPNGGHDPFDAQSDSCTKG